MSDLLFELVDEATNDKLQIYEKNQIHKEGADRRWLQCYDQDVSHLRAEKCSNQGAWGGVRGFPAGFQRKRRCVPGDGACRYASK